MFVRPRGTPVVCAHKAEAADLSAARTRLLAALPLPQPRPTVGMGMPFSRTAGVVGRRLAAADPAQHPRWTPRPEGDVGRVIDVYDGDSLTVLCSLGGELWRVSVRLRGVDCPEMRGRGPRERTAAIAVRDAVRAKCVDAICQLYAHGNDKYGRLIADVELPDGRDLAQFLLDAKLGRAYAGAARAPFTEAEVDGIVARAEALRRDGN